MGSDHIHVHSRGRSRIRRILVHICHVWLGSSLPRRSRLLLPPRRPRWRWRSILPSGRDFRSVNNGNQRFIDMNFIIKSIFIFHFLEFFNAFFLIHLIINLWSFFYGRIFNTPFLNLLKKINCDLFKFTYLSNFPCHLLFLFLDMLEFKKKMIQFFRVICLPQHPVRKKSDVMGTKLCKKADKINYFQSYFFIFKQFKIIFRIRSHYYYC